jgi:hypothetical protein
MEKFRITFELLDGEKHFYEIESESFDKLYERINNCPDGWIEVEYSGETHLIKSDKITRVKIISESDFNERQQETDKQMIQAISSWNY